MLAVVYENQDEYGKALEIHHDSLGRAMVLSELAFIYERIGAVNYFMDDKESSLDAYVECYYFGKYHDGLISKDLNEVYEILYLLYEEAGADKENPIFTDWLAIEIEKRKAGIDEELLQRGFLD